MSYGPEYALNRTIDRRVMLPSVSLFARKSSDKMNAKLVLQSCDHEHRI